MRTTAVAFVLLAYLALAALQDGPLQVGLLIFAPFALIAIGLVLHVADHSRKH